MPSRITPEMMKRIGARERLPNRGYFRIYLRPVEAKRKTSGHSDADTVRGTFRLSEHSEAGHNLDLEFLGSDKRIHDASITEIVQDPHHGKHLIKTTHGNFLVHNT